MLLFFLQSLCIGPHVFPIPVASSPVSRCNRLQSIASESLLTREAVNEQQLLKPAFHPLGAGRLKDFSSFPGREFKRLYDIVLKPLGIWLHIKYQK